MVTTAVYVEVFNFDFLANFRTCSIVGDPGREQMICHGQGVLAHCWGYAGEGRLSHHGAGVRGV